MELRTSEDRAIVRYPQYGADVCSSCTSHDALVFLRPSGSISLARLRPALGGSSSVDSYSKAVGHLPHCVVMLLSGGGGFITGGAQLLPLVL